MIAKTIDEVVLPILLLHPLPLPPHLHLHQRHPLPRILVAEILLPLTIILNHLVARVVPVATVVVIHHRVIVVVRVAERIQAVVVEVAAEIVVVVVVTSRNLEIINANLILLRRVISASSSTSFSLHLSFSFGLDYHKNK